MRVCTESCIQLRFINVNISQLAEKKKGTSPFSIALLHNLIFIDTGEECDADFFEVYLPGGVYEAHCEDFSFESFCLPVHSAGSIQFRTTYQVWHAMVFKWLIISGSHGVWFPTPLQIMRLGTRCAIRV